MPADLQYNECTWEGKSIIRLNLAELPLIFAAYDEIRQGAQQAIDSFHERQARNTVPARSIPYAIHARPTYQKINEDPDYIKVGGELKPFQLTGLNWLAYSWTQGENGILADEVSPRRCIS
jgi:chromodomain-helicase-DNA-binding protein 1